MDDEDEHFEGLAPPRHYSVDQAGRVMFSQLTSLLEKILKQGNRDKKIKLLRQFVDSWRKSGGDFHPVMRILIPQFDRERSAYGLKEATLAKIYVNILGLPKESRDAQNLLNYRDPSRNKKSSGDFATILENALLSRSTVKEGQYTIKDVNECLDKLNAADNQRETHRKVCHQLFKNCTPQEQKWIVRIILKSLKIGMTENTVLKVWHEMAQDMWQVTTSLREICDQLYDPNSRPAAQEIQLNSPFRPQLCERVKGDFRDIPKLMLNPPDTEPLFRVEIKLDGERIQVHKDGDTYKYWSRKQKEYTDLYGANSQRGTLTPFLDQAILDGIDNCILDGEVVVYDPLTDEFEKFGTLKTAALDLDSANDPKAKRPCFRIFDIVYVNGQSLELHPLWKRREILQRMVGREIKGRVEIHPYVECRSEADIMAELDKAMMNNEEGIVIKNVQSTYVPGLRSPVWIKVKPDYVEGMTELPDVALIGGWHGTGRRGKFLSHFLCAVRGPPDEETGRETYVTLCKVGTGLDFETMRQISEIPQKKYIRDKPPKWLRTERSIKVTPDVIFDPKDFPIVSLKAERFTESLEYAAGYTLRFPRVAKLREDYSIEDILSLDQVREFVNRPTEGRLNKRVADGTTRAGTKKRKIARGTPLSVISSHALPPQENVAKEGLFAGHTFYVLPAIGPDGTDSQMRELENVVQSAGGKLRGTAEHTDFIIADLKKRLKVHNLIQAKTRDIFRSSWIADSIAAGKLLEMEPRYLLFATDATAAKVASKYDEFGDTYEDPINNVDELKELLSRVDVDSLLERYSRSQQTRGKADVQARLSPSKSRYQASNMAQLKTDMDNRYWQGDLETGETVRPRGGMFRGKVVYVDMPSLRSTSVEDHDGSRLKEADETSLLQLTRAKLQFYGAEVVDRLYSNVSHIIVDPSEPGRSRTFFKTTAESRFRPRIVSPEWVDRSITEGAAVEEEPFTDMRA